MKFHPEMKMTTRSLRGKVKDNKSDAEEIVETTAKENGDAESSQKMKGKKKKKKGNKNKKTAEEKVHKFELLSQCGGYLVLAQGSEVRKCTVF